ncbi:hypothetical protein EB001_19505 [bacterium]|nr:hypothetical protein [bacterium]
MASLRDTLANLVEQYKASDVPAAYLMRGDAKGLWKDLNTPKPVDTAQDMTNLALGLVGSIKPVGKTAQELAHAVAQKNAVEMLGLHPENTAMDRAKALSFEFGYGHGSPNPNITELLPSRMGAEGSGVYATNYLPETSQYAGKEIGATSYPLAVRTDRALNVGTANPFEYLNESGTENLTKKLNKLGKDAIIRTHEETPEWLINAGADLLPARQHYVSNLPANFRSRFAAFDPARVNEPDLLAGAMALPIATDKDKRNKIIDLLKNK